MNEEKIEQLLQSADKSASGPLYRSDNLAPLVRRRARRRHTKIIIAPVAAAVLMLAGLCFFAIAKNPKQKSLTPEQIASLNAQIRDLNQKTDATLKLVREVIERQRSIERIAKLNAQLAEFKDPLEKLNADINKTAFILVSSADKMYDELNDKDSAIKTYNQVIGLFPQTPSAESARQKLLKIQNVTVNKNNTSI
jgi:septal ring factor EnvC (AmiA/AmiB activator)